MDKSTSNITSSSKPLHTSTFSPFISMAHKGLVSLLVFFFKNQHVVSQEW